MAKGSGRFRNRKLGFKTRINVEIGVVIEEDPLELDGLDLEDGEGIHERGGGGSHGHASGGGGGGSGGGGNQKQPKGIQTGVDKDEEGEVHLQQVIASTAAYVARNSAAGASSSSSSSHAAANAKKPASAYIPTRSSTTLPEDEFRALYKTGYVDPISYIRFSDTVEDTTRGAVNYTMDEDDEDWLEDFNEQFAKSSSSSRTDKGKGREGHDKADKVEVYDAFADAGKCLDELSDPKAPLSEDDFEKMMELLESVTEEKAPMAHVDISLLPPLLDFDYAFNDILRPELAALRPYAKPLYPHWRERRVQRGGKRIMPQLDYDESNEQNPYVCFRRRELKTSRKTRRSDQQNLERLVRLRNDLYAAHALMLKVAEREQIKLEAILAEKQIFEQRCETREVKRKLGEADGDEDLLVSRREKRRKREDGSVGALRLSLRKPDPNNISPASLVPSVEELQARKTRNDNLVKQIERDLQRKRQADQQFEDWTDASYLARPPPTPARFWRSVEPTPTASGKRDALGFAATWQAPIGRVRTSFRKRVGRGGRIYLDRIAPGRHGGGGKGGDDPHPPSHRRILSSLDDTDDESEPDEMDEWLRERRNERLRFDTDSSLDFPAADESPLLDDYDLRHLVRRAALLKPQDVQTLTFDSSYLEEAFKYVSSDPDKNQPPPTVIGRPPPRPPLQIHPSSGSLGGGGGPPPANPAAYAQAQAGIAAQQSLRVQQQQQLAAAQQMAAQRQRQAQSGSPNDQMRRPSSSNQGSPVGANQLPLPSNGAAQPQWNGQAANGAFPPHPGASPHSSPQHVNGLPLPPGPQQRLSNGALVVPGLQQPNGANGVPATSRLSHPPFSNPQAIQLAIQQQQQQSLVAQQQAAAMQAAAGMGMGRPLSANSQQLPSRPGSAASSSHHQHSPAMAALALPPQQQQGSPHLSPVAAAAALNLRQQNPPGTPPPGSAGLVTKRGSPMNYQMQAGGPGSQGGGVQGMKQPGYGNFIQG